MIRTKEKSLQLHNSIDDNANANNLLFMRPSVSRGLKSKVKYTNYYYRYSQ